MTLALFIVSLIISLSFTIFIGHWIYYNFVINYHMIKIRNDRKPPKIINVIYDTIKNDGTSIPFFIISFIISISIIIQIINLYK